MAVSLAEVLQRFGPEYLRTHSLGTAQAKAWRAIVTCRTPALGGQLLQCDACGRQQWRWHSCRNRHCPQCQAQARDAWRRARLSELLDVPYCHLVFTLPHELNALAAAHPRWLGGCGAFTLVWRWRGGGVACAHARRGLPVPGAGAVARFPRQVSCKTRRCLRHREAGARPACRRRTRAAPAGGGLARP